MSQTQFARVMAQAQHGRFKRSRLTLVPDPTPRSVSADGMAGLHGAAHWNWAGAAV
jgi:hypothetical protein